MKNKVWLLLFGAAILAFGSYYRVNLSPLHSRVAGVVLDRTVKTEHGAFIKVAEAVDGDTVLLINGERLRYIGIDTPEEVDERKPVQCYAREAAAKNRQLVAGTNIKFYKDVNEKDIYGRWLGFVYLEDGTFVNLELVRQGFAFAYPYPPDISKSAEFAQAETFARENKLGLWGGQCTITKLKSGRSQTNPIE